MGEPTEKVYSATEFIGDYPLENQPNWGKHFCLYEAMEVARTIYKTARAEAIDEHEAYYVVVEETEDGFCGNEENDMVNLIIHKNKEYQTKDEISKWFDDNHEMIMGINPD